MEAAELRRTLVVGNAGSGKTWLAARLSASLALPLVPLDDLHWLPGGYGVRRDKEDAVALVRSAAETERWVIEGVYGWLAEVAAPRATTLIWLDLPDADCIDALRRRGIQGAGSQADFDALLQWAGEYRTRTNANSYIAHRQLFDGFDGPKHRLMDRAAVDALAAKMSMSL